MQDDIQVVHEEREYDVDMDADDYENIEINKKLFDLPLTNTNDDMEVDKLDLPAEQINQIAEQKFESQKPVTDQEKLDYFHNVVKKQCTQILLTEDQRTQEDPLECSEYATEIFAHLKNTELEFIAQPGYMKKQSDINEKMRAILIDWLIEVHLKF